MYKHRNILILLLALTALSVPEFAHAAWWDALDPREWADAIFAIIGKFIIGLSSLIAILGGVALNASIYYTIIEMSRNIGSVGTIGPAINGAWTIIRDVANMGFIFMLLFISLQVILGMGKDTQRKIVNLIIVAILINFSLFFTKVIIDISNILAITFYNVIAQGTYEEFKNFYEIGLATSMMAALKVQTLMSPNATLTGANVLVLSILSSVVLLISAFVFLAAAVMFIIRYVVLIFVLILSPIAFVSFALPGLDDTYKKWKDALIGQAFFAPIYFLLMIVTIKVTTGISDQLFPSGSGGFGNVFTSVDVASVGTLINFGIVVAFLITTLVVAKDWANKAPKGVGAMTKWATGVAGGATFGAAARLGRNSIGSRFAAIANDEELKRRAREGSMTAKLRLATANKMANSSFDVRGTALGGPLEAGKPEKNASFIQDQKNRAKTFEKYKPSKKFQEEADRQLKEAQEQAKKDYEKTTPKPQELINAEKTLEDAKNSKYTPDATTGFDPEAARKFEEEKKAKIKKAQEELDKQKERYYEAAEGFIKKRTEKEERDANSMEHMAKRAAEPYIKFGNFEILSGNVISGHNKAKAIRDAAKQKDKKEQMADLAKDIAKEEAEAEGKKDEPKEDKPEEKKDKPKE